MTQFLLRAVSSGDDTSLEFSRHDGNGAAPVFCFLPWKMPFRLAQGMGLVPRDYVAAFEMPSAIVSSEPQLCVDAMHAVVDDAVATLERSKLRDSEVVVLGYSIGSASATYFANRVGAQLWSVASADRGDLMMWESEASRAIKERAIAKGYTLADLTEATRGLHPIENLANLAPQSRFVLGSRDEFVPKPRRDALAAHVRSARPCDQVSFLDASHVRTMIGAVAPWFRDASAGHAEATAA